MTGTRLAMTRAMAGTALAWATLVSTAPAQTPDVTSDVELSRAAIQVRRQAIVTASMDLEPREAEAFWPLYREYRLAMMTVNDRLVKLLGEFLDHHATLTDETATRLMDDYAGIERDRAAVKTAFVPRFRAVMPPRKVARFFQVEHKLDAVIEAELSRQIPLAR